MKTFLTEHVPLRSLKASILSLILGIAGTVLASIILIDKIALAANPNFVTSCSFNPVVSCSPVMKSAQAAAFFGIPNPILGLIGFGAVAMLSFLTIFATLPRFIWFINLIGTTFALAFCFWLSTQALFVIGALCIYCCGVWVVVTLLFWLSVRRVTTGTKLAVIGDYSFLGVVVTLVTFALMVFIAFQSFWLSLL